MQTTESDTNSYPMFVVRRDRLTEHRLLRKPKRELGEGEVELSVDRFAFTANNVTYGVVADMFGYWNFFPTGEEGWGCIPVWGFGTVVRSKHEAVKVGERFFGYYPMASRLVVAPGKITPAGFTDASPHRAGMSGVYNRYALTTADPGYRPEHEPLLMLFRPLFGTAFFIDDYLAQNGFFGAEAIVFASASSKTAYSSAFLLSERRKAGARIETVGITSRTNLEFVRQLGVYDQVVDYDAIESLAARPAVYFDMAGSSSVTAAVHRKYGDLLKHSAIVGFTHWEEDRGTFENLPGPAPQMFFVPTLMQERTKELGAEVLQQRIGAAWQSFLARATAPGSEWVKIVEGRGPPAIEQVYTAALAGRLPPREGHILSFGA